MSHVDEGTLHAYLDGELAPVERERVDTHLKGCPACQARLAEERALIERASRLLGMATPPERAAPPLQQLRQPRLGWRLRRPLAWAATLILAVGVGWFARDQIAPQPETDTSAGSADRLERPGTVQLPPVAAEPDSPRLKLSPLGHLALRRTIQHADSIDKDREAVTRQPQSAEAATDAAANGAIAARDPTATGASGAQKTGTLAQLPPPAPSGVKVRGQVPAAPEPQVTIDGSLANGSLYGRAARQRATPVMSTTWPIIARQPAHDVLGVEPVVIPGFVVRTYRRNPAAQEIAVEQVTDAGTTISLIERRVDLSLDEVGRADAAANAPRAMAKAVNERLARFVGSLRIEIDGPLTPDSLSTLLELAR